MNDFDSKLNQFFGKFDEAVKVYFPNMLAETAVEHFKNALIKKSWDGQPYPAYGDKAREPRRGTLMMRTNALFNTIKPKTVSSSTVIISAGNSRVRYARIHNEGLRVTGTFQVRAFTNRNFMGKGKPVDIRSHKRKVDYTMPKRQFMGKSRLLFAEVKTRFKNTFKDHLK